MPDTDLTLGRADVTVTPSRFKFQNYQKLLHASELIERQYSQLQFGDDDYQQAKKIRAKLNRLDRAVNDERKKYRKAYAEPYKAFKGQVDAIRSHIERASKGIDAQIKAIDVDYQQARTKELEPTMHTICASRGVPDQDIPPQALKRSASKKGVLELLAGIADDYKHRQQMKADVIHGGELIDPATGEIDSDAVGAVIQFKDSKANYRKLMKFIKDNDINVKIKK